MDTKDFKIIFLQQIFNTCKSYFNFISDEVALFIACQFALESNFGCSDLAIFDNNFSGMKFPSFRLYFGKRSDNFNDFLQYSSVNLCVLDYFLRCSYFSFHRKCFIHLDDFKRELRNSGYCPEKDYISRIDTLFNQYSFIISKS